MIHSKVSLDEGRHSIIAYVYASSVQRTGATGFTVEDLGKIALQSNDGTYWILTGTAPTWALVPIGVTPGGGSTWNTLIDVDFSAQPDAAYATDGIVTIDGQTWTIDQTARAASGYQLAEVNGRGLRMCRSTGSVDIAARTSPLACWAFPGVVHWYTPLRAVLSIAHYDAWNNWAGVSFGIDAQSSAVGWRSGYIVNRITSDGQANFMSNAYGVITRGEVILPPHGWALEGNSNPGAGSTPATAYDSIGLFLPNGYGQPATMSVLRGKASHGIFTDFSQMRLMNTLVATASGYVDAPADYATDESLSWGITIMGIGTDANQRMYAVRLKVEAYY